MAFGKRRSRLVPGACAPDFTAQSSTGDSFTLSSLRGSKVWLAFFRYASCPLCNLRIAELITRHDALTRQGVAVVAVLQSGAARVAEFVGKQSPPFTILCDPAERLYEMYGLEASVRGYAHPKNAVMLARAAAKGFMASSKMDGTKTRLPADFLISQQGRIEDAFYADVISAHISFARVERFAA